jgi:hypothetical protein
MTRLEKLSRLKEETKLVTIKIPSSLSDELKEKASDLKITKSRLTYELFMAGCDELFGKEKENV